MDRLMGRTHTVIVLSGNLLGPFITHSDEWTGMEEWTVEFWCTVDGIIAHCVLVAFVPFHPGDLRRVSFNIAAKASSYVSEVY